ncbi:unnamed protein product [Colias eurytheme]|nr:unnamed protein product [Colias eurytheme]
MIEGICEALVYIRTSLIQNEQNTRTPENNSASSRSSSISSEQESIRPPLQRMTPISPPTSPQENSGRCVRIYKIPQSNLSAAAYQRQSVSADHVVCSYFNDRPNSIRQKLAALRLDSKSRGGGDEEANDSHTSYN